MCSAPHTSVYNMAALNSLNGYLQPVMQGAYAHLMKHWNFTYDKYGSQAHIYVFCLDPRTQRLSMKICSPIPKTTWNKQSPFLIKHLLENALSL